MHHSLIKRKTISTHIHTTEKEMIRYALHPSLFLGPRDLLTMVSSHATESYPLMALRTELWSSTRGAATVNQQLSQPASPYF